MFFEFCQEVIDDDRHYYRFDELSFLREQLSQNDQKILLTDLGAGSHATKSKERTIASIAKHSVSPDYFLQLLFRLMRYKKPAVTLEFGTSLGLSALALIGGYSGGEVITMEGDPQIAQIAEHHFRTLNVQNVRLLTGNFDDLLPPVLDAVPQIDLAFIDGNHRGEATLRYFNALLPRTTENSILVFDDIHWTQDMEDAWRQIKAHPAVRGTIDLFKMGFVFFDSKLLDTKHLQLVPHRYKPWTSAIKLRNKR